MVELERCERGRPALEDATSHVLRKYLTTNPVALLASVSSEYCFRVLLSTFSASLARSIVASQTSPLSRLYCQPDKAARTSLLFSLSGFSYLRLRTHQHCSLRLTETFRAKELGQNSRAASLAQERRTVVHSLCTLLCLPNLRKDDLSQKTPYTLGLPACTGLKNE